MHGNCRYPSSSYCMYWIWTLTLTLTKHMLHHQVPRLGMDSPAADGIDVKFLQLLLLLTSPFLVSFLPRHSLAVFACNCLFSLCLAFLCFFSFAPEGTFSLVNELTCALLWSIKGKGSKVQASCQRACSRVVHTPRQPEHCPPYLGWVAVAFRLVKK